MIYVVRKDEGAIARAIASALRAAGAEVTVTKSKLSPSKYIVAEVGDDFERSVEIRVSHHTQRPTYYRDVDIEVGNNIDADTSDIAEAIALACARLSLEVPAFWTAEAIASRSQRAADAAKNRAIKRMEEEREMVERISAEAIENGLRSAFALLNHLGGDFSAAAKKRIRAEVKRRFMRADAIKRAATATDEELLKRLEHRSLVDRDVLIATCVELRRRGYERPSGFPRFLWTAAQED